MGSLRVRPELHPGPDPGPRLLHPKAAEHPRMHLGRFMEAFSDCAMGCSIAADDAKRGQLPCGRMDEWGRRREGGGKGSGCRRGWSEIEIEMCEAARPVGKGGMHCKRRMPCAPRKCLTCCLRWSKTCSQRWFEACSQTHSVGMLSPLFVREQVFMPCHGRIPDSEHVNMVMVPASSLSSSLRPA